jgi:hypothetical protein
MVLGFVNSSLGKEKLAPLRILLDSGATSSIILGKWTKKLRNKPAKTTSWNTKGGTFKTNLKCKIQFSLPEFNEHKVIEHTVHVDTNTKNSRYDMIVGSDLLSELGFIFDYESRIMTWEGSSVPMKMQDSLQDPIELISYIEELFESESVKELKEWQDRILDADYHKADLNKVTAEAVHLVPEEQK